MSQEAPDSNEGSGNDSKKPHLKLYHLVMLASFIIGTEGTTVFGQIYTLLTLEYLGVPTSLATANGIVGGCSAVFLIPLCGWWMDKGKNPKRRKLLALGLSAFVFITAFTTLLVSALIKITEGKNSKQAYNYSNDVKGNGEDVAEKSQNVSSSMQRSNSQANQTLDDVLLPFSETPPDLTGGTPWIPVTGILGLVAFSLVDLAFDLGNFFSRAFALDHTPARQHRVILMMVSFLAPGAGAFVSVFGILDFPGILGDAFDVDGTAATLIFFVAFLSTVVISCTLCTIITGLWVARTNGFLLQSDQLSRSLGHSEEVSFKERSAGNCRSCSSPFVGEGISCPHCTLPDKVIGESSSENGSSEVKRADSFYEKTPLLVNAKTPKINHESLSSKTNHGIGNTNGAKTVTPSPLSESKDCTSKDCMTEPKVSSQGRQPYFFSKKLVILIMATYASMFCMVHFSMFGSNALTVGVLHGDPRASVGTKGKELYTEGLRKSALGGTIFYLSYFITSTTNGKFMALIGERMIFLVSHVLHALTTLVFVYLQRVELFYVSMATFGPFRWALFTIPYMMANEFTNSTMGSDASDRKRGLSKAGRVVSIISVIGPINYLTSSASMGPLLAVTDNVWLPLVFSCSGGFLSALLFIPLFFLS